MTKYIVKPMLIKTIRHRSTVTIQNDAAFSLYDGVASVKKYPITARVK